MARENIPVGLFYASYPSDCTYEVNSRLMVIAWNTLKAAERSAFQQRAEKLLQRQQTSAALSRATQILILQPAARRYTDFGSAFYEVLWNVVLSYEFCRR